MGLCDDKMKSSKHRRRLLGVPENSDTVPSLAVCPPRALSAAPSSPIFFLGQVSRLTGMQHKVRGKRLGDKFLTGLPVPTAPVPWGMVSAIRFLQTSCFLAVSWMHKSGQGKIPVRYYQTWNWVNVINCTGSYEEVLKWMKMKVPYNGSQDCCCCRLTLVKSPNN